MNLALPQEVFLDLKTGRIAEGAARRTVRLSDLKGVFADASAFEEMAGTEDPVVYEVLEIANPEREGEMNFGVSILHAGKVGQQHFMTRGHLHKKQDTAEVYFCLKGSGDLLMQAEGGSVLPVKMTPGTVAYVPPGYAHRTVNTGTEEFICFYAVPSDAGHDYIGGNDRSQWFS